MISAAMFVARCVVENYYFFIFIFFLHFPFAVGIKVFLTCRLLGNSNSMGFQC